MGFLDPVYTDPAQVDDSSKMTANRLYDEQNRQQQKTINAVNARTDPQASKIAIGAMQHAQGATIDAASQAAQQNYEGANINRQDNEVRDRQMNFLSQLQNQANGQAPSLADQQLKQATNRGIAQQVAMAASQGGNAALAQRQAAVNAANINQDAAGQAVNTRLQEQMNARQQLGAALDATRGQDIGVNTNQAQMDLQRNLAQAAGNQQVGLANADALNARAMQQAQLGQQANFFNATAENTRTMNQAQLDQQTALANLEAQLKARGLNDEQIRAIMAQQMMNTQNYQNNNLSWEQLKSANANAAAAANAGVNASADAATGQAAGAMGSAMLMAAMASDENLKKNIKPASKEQVSKFLDALKGYSYDYKDKKFGEGEHTSVMAQDLEKSELGKKMVLQTPEGKMVHYGKGLATMLAAQAMQNDRLNEIEELLKKRGKK